MGHLEWSIKKYCTKIIKAPQIIIIILNIGASNRTDANVKILTYNGKCLLRFLQHSRHNDPKRVCPNRDIDGQNTNKQALYMMFNAFLHYYFVPNSTSKTDDVFQLDG